MSTDAHTTQDLRQRLRRLQSDIERAALIAEDAFEVELAATLNQISAGPLALALRSLVVA